MRFILILVLCCCAGQTPEPDAVALLESQLPEGRLHGLFLMDKGQMTENIDLLMRLAENDPSVEVRSEVIRQLGYTGDSATIGLLKSHLENEFADEAAESLGYLGAPGCRVLADKWQNAPRDAQGNLLDRHLRRALTHAFEVTAPECANALR